MPKIEYVPKTFNAEHRLIIERTNEIVRDYRRQNLSLTLRQVYYQFVSRGWMPNKDTQYERLGSIINDARLAGEVDWRAIEDRTRHTRSHWYSDEPDEYMRTTGSGWTCDPWEGQDNFVEVWIEKDALVGVITGVCNQYRVNFLSCRGYVSASTMWEASQRLIAANDNGKRVTILHLGDHDPSGIDMSRDIEDRLRLFGADFELRRIALNMDQVRQYNPPPNPAKLSDSRSSGYIEQYGNESWELDALEPAVMIQLVRDNVVPLIDPEPWNERLKEQARTRAKLMRVGEHWDEVRDYLDEHYPIDDDELSDDDMIDDA